MQLLTNIDPRDNLQKATRWELIDYAKANGVDVPHDAPAIYTMKVLRARGLTRINVPERPLGLYAGGEALSDQTHLASDTEVNAASADDDLIRQYEQQKKEETDVTKMLMPQLRHACKTNGIKMDRRDNLKTLREKLSAHGQSHTP